MSFTRTLATASGLILAASVFAATSSSATSAPASDITPLVTNSTTADKNVPTMRPGYMIRAGRGLRSENATYGALMLRDGNFAVINLRKRCAIWTSETAGHPGAILRLRKSGNLLITHGRDSIWGTKTATADAEQAATTRLTMENDGDLVLYRGTYGDDERELWHSETSNADCLGSAALGDISTDIVAPAREDADATEAVEFAKMQLGNAHAHGAMGWERYGNIEYVYMSWKEAGVELPRRFSVKSWSAATKRYAYKDRQPGDIVLYLDKRTRTVRAALVAEDINNIYESVVGGKVSEFPLYAALRGTGVLRPQVAVEDDE